MAAVGGHCEGAKALAGVLASLGSGGAIALRGGGASGFDYIQLMTKMERECNDLDKPILSRDRRFIIRVPKNI